MSNQIGVHFTEAEVGRSQVATRKGIKNTPTEKVLANATILVESVLDQVRDFYRQPIQPSSWYRSPELNKAIGGSPKSQHLTGLAVDFVVPGVSNKEVCVFIASNCNFDQVIQEYGDEGWVHLSAEKEPGTGRREYLVYDGKSYKPGVIE